MTQKPCRRHFWEIPGPHDWTLECRACGHVFSIADARPYTHATILRSIERRRPGAYHAFYEVLSGEPRTHSPELTERLEAAAREAEKAEKAGA